MPNLYTEKKLVIIIIVYIKHNYLFIYAIFSMKCGRPHSGRRVRSNLMHMDRGGWGSETSFCVDVINGGSLNQQKEI